MIRGVCYRYFNETRVSTPHEEVLPVPLKQAWKYWYNRVELRALRIQCCRKNVCLYVLRNQVSYIRRLPISSTNPMLRTMTQYRYSNRKWVKLSWECLPTCSGFWLLIVTYFCWAYKVQVFVLLIQKWGILSHKIHNDGCFSPIFSGELLLKIFIKTYINPYDRDIFYTTQN